MAVLKSPAAAPEMVMTNKLDGVDELLRVVNIREQADGPGEQSAEYEAGQFADNEIGPGKQVTLHFALAFADSPESLIDSNFDAAAVTFCIGDGNLLPGFERVMFGLKAEQEKEFIVPASQAFGERHADNIQRYPRYQFPADLLMEKGLMINFSDAAGNEQAGVVHQVHADEVDIDFNHPLAGRDILFRVAIKAVQPVLR